MNIYECTRNKNITTTPSKAVLNGLAPDGGLFVMRDLENISIDINKIITMSYIEMAEYVLGKLLPDYPADVMKQCVKKILCVLILYLQMFLRILESVRLRLLQWKWQMKVQF